MNGYSYFGIHSFALSTLCTSLSTSVGQYLSTNYGVLFLKHMIVDKFSTCYCLCQIFILFCFFMPFNTSFWHFQISTSVLPTHVKISELAMVEWICILALVLLVILGTTARLVRGTRMQLYFADYSRHFWNGMRFPLAHWEVVNGLGNVW